MTATNSALDFLTETATDDPGQTCAKSELVSSKRTATRALAAFLWNVKYGFSVSKPRRTARIVRNLFNVRFRGKRPCRTIDICVTFNCNLRCEHCFSEAFKVSHNNRRQPPLTLDEYAKLGREVDELGFFAVTFTGGEPIVRNDLFEIIERFDPGSKFISIGTNGTLWTDALLRRAKQAGVDCLYVSIDDLDPAVHDRFRGKRGTLQKAFWTIEHARKVGLKIAVNTTLTKNGLYSRNFRDIIHWARDQGVLLMLNLACPAGNWRHRKELYFSEEDTDALAQLLLKHSHVRIDYEGNYREWGCPAFKERFYITATGDVLPCPFIHVSFGNIRDLSLSEIRDRGLQTTHFRDYKPVCLAAQDQRFLHKYLFPIQDQDVLPADFRDVFDGADDWVSSKVERFE